MKHWVRLASHFYPAAWRKRYAVEFDALLEDLGAGWMDIFDILKGAFTMRVTAWSIKTILIAFAAIGAMIAGAVAFSIPNEYRSTSITRFTSTAGDARIAQDLSGIEQETLSRTSLEGLIEKLDLYKEQRSRAPMEEIVANMRNRDILIKTIHQPGRSDTAFAFETAYPDPKLAQAINRELLADFMKTAVAIHTLTTLEVLDPPSLPGYPVYPRKAQFVFTGVGAGLLMGLLASLALGWRIMIVRRPAH